MKFSIRDLLLVTVIVAILLAWWVDRRRQAIENQELRNRLRDFYGELAKLALPDTSAPAPIPPKR